MHHKGLTIWFTGLSGAGKTTITQHLAAALRQQGLRVECLDGDTLRKTLTADLGFSASDRAENIRRIGNLAQELTNSGAIVLVAVIAPYQHLRAALREQIGAYIEVYVDAPLALCEQRDPKGLYRRARSGEIRQFTGIDDPYEPPIEPEIVCYTDRESIAESVTKTLAYLTAVLAIDLSGSRSDETIAVFERSTSFRPLAAINNHQ
jgi:adenylylsulfate kinase